MFLQRCQKIRYNNFKYSFKWGYHTETCNISLQDPNKKNLYNKFDVDLVNINKFEVGVTLI